MKYITALLIIIGSALACFSQAKPITFTDDSTLEVTHEQKSEDAPKSKITFKNKYLNADFNSIGKAVPPLDEKTLKRLARINKSLAAQIKKIHTAYEIKQGDSQYYFATYNSVNYENFRSCNADAPCKIKGEAIIITLDNKGKKENILIIKSIQKIK